MGCQSSQACVQVRDCAVNISSFHDDYRIVERLGKGAYGSVYLVRHTGSREECAAKVVALTDDKPAKGSQRKPGFWQEQKVWSLVCKHPNIVYLQDWYTDSNFGYFLMERCSGQLLQAWTSEEHMTEHTYARYFSEMAVALQHVHSFGIVHRDVKHDNFLLGGQFSLSVKLCDFGMSSMLSDSTEALTKAFGTPPYMAPETVTPGMASGFACDVWSLGVIAYVAFFGCWPYLPKTKDPNKMKKAICHGNPLPRFRPSKKLPQGRISDVAMEFVYALLDRDQSTRPSASDCLQLDYIANMQSHAAQAEARSPWEICLSPMLDGAMKCGAFSACMHQEDPFSESILREEQFVAIQRHETKTKKSKQRRDSDGFAGIVPSPAGGTF